MRIHEYSLIRDVVASQQRPRIPQAMWLGPPLVVMNNFGAPEKGGGRPGAQRSSRALQAGHCSLRSSSRRSICV